MEIAGSPPSTLARTKRMTGGLVVTGLAGGVLVNVVSAKPVAWGWLTMAVGFAVAVFAAYLWFRLSR